MGLVRSGSALAAAACLSAGCGAPSVTDPGGGWVYFTAVPPTAGDGASSGASSGVSSDACIDDWPTGFHV